MGGRGIGFGRGYSTADVAALLGESRARIRRLRLRGRFGRKARAGGSITPRQIQRFIQEQVSEYDFTRVSQAWFKAVVFGQFDSPSLQQHVDSGRSSVVEGTGVRPAFSTRRRRGKGLR